MELSVRLQAVADMVTEGTKVADVGTDHAYIPIYLVEHDKNPSAIAMDINRGPLKKAEENISSHNLENKIETRLSDGLKQLHLGEADSVVIAGMGGGLVVKIMEEGTLHKKYVKEWILQPQSEISKVRQYLNENGYCIVEENMVIDEGKFYPMMRVTEGTIEEYTQEELCYGKCLLKEKNPILKKFLEKEIDIKKEILEKLHQTKGGQVAKRIEEIEEETDRLQKTLSSF
ncbi:class I SAM-dependent methyltransferase [Faecalimonas hominis]